MRNPVAIENIEEMRRRQGIEDVELREEICGLEIGDFVKLTLLSSTKSSAGETSWWHSENTGSPAEKPFEALTKRSSG